MDDLGINSILACTNCHREIFNYWFHCPALGTDAIFCFPCYKTHTAACTFQNPTHTISKKYTLQDLHLLLKISETLSNPSLRRNSPANVLVYSLCAQNHYNFIENLSSQEGTWIHHIIPHEFPLTTDHPDSSPLYDNPPALRLSPAKPKKPKIRRFIGKNPDQGIMVNKKIVNIGNCAGL